MQHFLAPFLAFFFPHIHADIDWAQGYESLDKELHQIARSSRGSKALADKLFKVWRYGEPGGVSPGSEIWLLIHIEVQGEPEEDFPRRMFRYNTFAFHRYNRPVVSLAVLTDARPDWRPDRFEYGAWDADLVLRFLTAKLLDWRGREADLETSANPFAQVVLAHLRALETRGDPEQRRRYKLAMVKGLYRTGWDAEDVRQLFRVVDWLLDLPPELKQGFEAELFEWEETRMPPYITSIERSGIEKGLKEAIAMALGTSYGAPGKRLMPRVQALSEADELRALLKAILSGATLKEIRDRLSPRGE